MLVSLVNEFGVDVVGDGTESLLSTVTVLAGGGIGFEDAQDDGVNDGEGTGREEALTGGKETVVSQAPATCAHRESHRTNEHCVGNNTPSRNQLVLLSPIRQTAPIQGPKKVENLENHCKIEERLLDPPKDADELEDEGVRGVHEPIEEEVEHLGDDQPSLNKVG